MRIALTPLALTLLLAFAGCASSRYDTSRAYPAYARVGSTGGNTTYAVCHQGRNSLTLPEPAIRAHLRHGDYFGSCSRANRARHDDHYRRGNGNQGNGNRGNGNQGRGRGN